MIKKIKTVVLCGGKSTRMGSDKGLLQKEGKQWAVYMAEKLIPWRLSAVFSINAGQLSAYSAIIPLQYLIIDSLGLPGPLEGLFTVHQRFPEHDLLLLACDMLDLDTPTIEKILSQWQQKNDYDFYAYEKDGWFQPFCGIYTAAGLDRVEELGNFSLQALLQGGRTKKLPVENIKAFTNYNTV